MEINVPNLFPTQGSHEYVLFVYTWHNIFFTLIYCNLIATIFSWQNLHTWHGDVKTYYYKAGGCEDLLLVFFLLCNLSMRC